MESTCARGNHNLLRDAPSEWYPGLSQKPGSPSLIDAVPLPIWSSSGSTAGGRAIESVDWTDGQVTEPTSSRVERLRSACPRPDTKGLWNVGVEGDTLIGGKD